MTKEEILQILKNIEEAIIHLLELEDLIVQLGLELEQQKSIHISKIKEIQERIKELQSSYARYRRLYNETLHLIDKNFHKLYELMSFTNEIYNGITIINHSNEIVIIDGNSKYRLFPKERYDLTVYDFIVTL